VRYGTRHSGDKSGAYLFLPDGPGRVSAVSKSPVRVVEGRLRAYVEVRQGWNTHRATLLNSPGVDGTSVLVSLRIWLINKMQDKIVFRKFSKKEFWKLVLSLFIVRYCSARDWERSGLLEENPQSGCTEIRASLKGPLQVYSQPMLPVKLRYEASQVWMNATFIPQGQQSLV
jgi:hypothetical protein